VGAFEELQVAGRVLGLLDLGQPLVEALADGVGLLHQLVVGELLLAAVAAAGGGEGDQRGGECGGGPHGRHDRRGRRLAVRARS
jgi:hypothetical protein